jgi:hypothetical protein
MTLYPMDLIEECNLYTDALHYLSSTETPISLHRLLICCKDYDDNETFNTFYHEEVLIRFLASV